MPRSDRTQVVYEVLTHPELGALTVGGERVIKGSKWWVVPEPDGVRVAEAATRPKGGLGPFTTRDEACEYAVASQE